MRARVTAVRTLLCDTGQGRNFLFVLVETDAGVVGVGEASQNDQDAAVIACVEQLAPRYVGRSVLDLVERSGRLLRSSRTGRAIFCAVSGVEQAIWDVCGKVLGVPVHQLLGGACGDGGLKCYATIASGLPDARTDTVVAEATRCVSEGFGGVKVVPFMRRETRDGIELVAAVREAIGPDAELFIECAFALDAGRARSIAHALEPYDCAWLEAPLPWDDANELAALRRAIPQRLASGETLLGRVAYRELLEARAVDVLQPDVKWTGGILEAKKVAAWAEAYQVLIAPHNNSGPVATAASAQLAATLPNFFVLETPSRAPAWEEDLVCGSSVVSGGCVSLDRLRERPGLGIEFAEDVARRVAP